MNISKLVKQICCVTLVAASAAHAADKSSVADQMYLRVGGGAMWPQAFKEKGEVYVKKALKAAPLYFIGLGYQLTQAISSDITVQYGEIRYKNVGSAGGTSQTLTQKISTTGAMLNGYYDINIHNMFTPYLTAGVGIGKNKVGQLKETNTAGGKEAYAGKNKTGFIWAVGAGVKFNVNKSFAIDLGYRFADLGKTEIYDHGDNAKLRQKLRGQQAVAALIYKF